MAFAVVVGLLFALAATFVSMALLVRTSFGRVPHAITAIPVSLVLYSLWVSAWFVFECLRQFVLTVVTPATALRLVAFVFLAAACFSLAFLYGCISAVHQLLGGKPLRWVRRAVGRRGAHGGSVPPLPPGAWHADAKHGIALY